MRNRLAFLRFAYWFGAIADGATIVPLLVPQSRLRYWVSTHFTRGLTTGTPAGPGTGSAARHRGYSDAAFGLGVAVWRLPGGRDAHTTRLA